jgi:PPOX class probable F420-dependent enzyme
VDAAIMRQKVETARVARLATTDSSGQPHVVPITFALADDRLVWAVDHKPKATVDLKRVRNLTARPDVSVLVDYYDDDWTTLWWVRVDGTARVLDSSDDRDRVIEMLVAKYDQYRNIPPIGPAVEITIKRWVGWSA